MDRHIATSHVAVLNETAARCCDALAAEPAVTAVYLTGSLARGDADEHSDIDLCAVVQREHLELVLSRAEAIASAACEIMAGGWFPETACYSVLYDISECIVKVDYDYVSSAKISEMLTIQHPYLCCRKLIFDRQRSIGAGYVEPLPDVPTELPQYQGSVAVSAWSVVRMVRRGELLEALDILSHIRDPFVTRLLCTVADVPFENYRRMEQKLPCPLLTWLRRTFPAPESGAILRSLDDLLSLYLHLCEVLRLDLGQRELNGCSRVREEVQSPLRGQDDSAALDRSRLP